MPPSLITSSACQILTHKKRTDQATRFDDSFAPSRVSRSVCLISLQPSSNCRVISSLEQATGDPFARWTIERWNSLSVRRAKVFPHLARLLSGNRNEPSFGRRVMGISSGPVCMSFRAGLAKRLVPSQPLTPESVALLLTVQAMSDIDATELRRRCRVTSCIGPSSQEHPQGCRHVNTSATLDVRTPFECRTTTV